MEMIEISGLWKGTDKNGNTYYSGYMGRAKILIFKNKYKEEDKHPDFKMYIAPPKPKSGQGQQSGQEGYVYKPDDDEL